MQLEVSVLSNPGGRERNEDACGFWTGGGGCFCVVSDGAGGHGGGDIASKLAVRMILSSFQDAPECTGPAIEAALRAAHAAIVIAAGRASSGPPRCARPRPSSRSTPCATRRSGATSATRACTASAAAASSRRRRTTASSRRWSTRATSRRTRCGSRAQRSRLFAALGHDDDFVSTVAAAPFAIEGGDVFLLCTDGFWEYIDEAAMAEALAGTASPAEWLRRMEQDVVKNGREGQDNFSAVAVWCTEAAPASSR